MPERVEPGRSVDTTRVRRYRPAVTDLFKEKAQEWDARPVPAQISEGVGAALVAKVPLRADLRVMDFGAGTGLICARVAPHVQTIYAVDISAAMLEQLAMKPQLRDKVEVFCQNILETPLGRPVDLIISAMALHHVEDTSLLVRTFADHLEPGGRLALADLDKDDGSFHGGGDTAGVFHHGFVRDELRQQLAAGGFKDIEFVTATQVDKNDHHYDIFLVTATKA
jgi:2-polyprenyl-3-methyl-5-hydroxy-6-metoxy-1,4-benzoquinol methylase